MLKNLESLFWRDFIIKKIDANGISVLGNFCKPYNLCLIELRGLILLNVSWLISFLDTKYFSISIISYSILFRLSKSLASPLLINSKLSRKSLTINFFLFFLGVFDFLLYLKVPLF